MNKRRLDTIAQNLPSTSPVTMGLVIAALWGLSAAVPQIPRQGYFLLPMTAAAAAGFILWRLVSSRWQFQFGGKSGLSIGLGCWFVAASMSALLNAGTDQVLVTYLAVFLSGSLIYVALSGVTLTEAQCDIAIAALAIGSLFPLVAGIQAFGGEWGSPDLTTVASAYRHVARMSSYEQATFGNRGNTAAFLMIVAPLMLSHLMDGRKRVWVRGCCAAGFGAAVMNLLILQVRAAFLCLCVVLVIVWLFKLGLRRLPVLVVAAAAALVLLLNLSPDASTMMGDSLTAAVTVDTEGDVSIQERAEAIREGWRIATNNWLLGIGPGAALTQHSHDSAHQFQVQQAMETGFLGLFGATVFSISTLFSLIRTMGRGRHDATNDMRFTLLLGPAAYVLYSVTANAALGFGSLNTWTVLIMSMLALMPGFDKAARTSSALVVRRRTLAARQPLRAAPRSRPSAVRETAPASRNNMELS